MLVHMHRCRGAVSVPLGVLSGCTERLGRYGTVLPFGAVQLCSGEVSQLRGGWPGAQHSHGRVRWRPGALRLLREA